MLPITVENDYNTSLNMWNGKVMYLVSVLGIWVGLHSPSSLHKICQIKVKNGPKLVCMGFVYSKFR